MNNQQFLFQTICQHLTNGFANCQAKLNCHHSLLVTNQSEVRSQKSEVERKFKMMIKFIGFAIRSLAEAVTCLHKASKRIYISEEEFREHNEYAFNLMNMMAAFKEKIK